MKNWEGSAKYWEKAFNPVIGCNKISEGCLNCYAKGVVERFGINDGDFKPTVMTNAKAPKSGIVFVGNMTDIFGEWVSHHQLFDILYSLNDKAINLILTKRAKRFNDFAWRKEECWFGVTCENQTRADERIPELLKADVLHRWLSLEPLLGEIDLQHITRSCERGLGEYVDCLTGEDWQESSIFGGSRCGLEPDEYYEKRIKLVVIGAESLGNNAGRECKIEWIEKAVNDCLKAGVPVFVKQIHIDGKLIKDINKFPEHLRIRQIPDKFKNYKGN
ncbi:MAG: phage Gp37/Gp68 family protein [Melioribacteraceae bacterium]|nr:phage Gp37/Gp68 family protein [Melioribacteraceae bacterium]